MCSTSLSIVSGILPTISSFMFQQRIHNMPWSAFALSGISIRWQSNGCVIKSMIVELLGQFIQGIHWFPPWPIFIIPNLQTLKWCTLLLISAWKYLYDVCWGKKKWKFLFFCSVHSSKMLESMLQTLGSAPLLWNRTNTSVSEKRWAILPRWSS